MNLAPIILFVYNRPQHTKRTLETLKKNILANESTLYIYSDGIKKNSSKETINKVLEVRELIKSELWCKEVHIIESEVNKGLASSIVDGVSEIVNKYGKIIVLEDDIITSKGFLKYMNEALELYENEDRVMHISGFMYPMEVDKSIGETFFYNTTSCWGWATWSRAWNKLNTNINNIFDKFNNKEIIKRFNYYSPDHYGQILSNKNGIIKTWAIKWAVTVFFENGYCLHPYKSLVNNIGFDNTGTNSLESNLFLNNNLVEFIEVKKINLEENKFILKKTELFYQRKYKEYLIDYIKTITPKKIKDYIRSNIFSSREDISVDNFINLFKMKKNKATIYRKKISIIDNESFLKGYKSIFIRKVLDFKSNKKDPIIIDCGSNIGLGIIYLKKIFPNSKIISFEADRDTFKTLKDNIELFNFKDIKLINKALFDKKTIINFNNFYRKKHINLNIDEAINTETDILSDYLKEEIDFLKINISGFETIVLEESSNYLNNINNIFIEYHSILDESSTLHKILQILDKNNFKYYIENDTSINSLKPFNKINYNKYMDNKVYIYGYRF